MLHTYMFIARKPSVCPAVVTHVVCGNKHRSELITVTTPPGLTFLKLLPLLLLLCPR